MKALTGSRPSSTRSSRWGSRTTWSSNSGRRGLGQSRWPTASPLVGAGATDQGEVPMEGRSRGQRIHGTAQQGERAVLSREEDCHGEGRARDGGEDRGQRGST